MLAAILFAAVPGVAACDDGAPPTGPSRGDVVGVIENNHGHTAIVTGRQIAEGRALPLDIRGAANHGHLLEITDDNIQRLQRRDRVEVNSSLENNHRHRVTFN
jgi:hypothetical protein